MKVIEIYHQSLAMSSQIKLVFYLSKNLENIYIFYADHILPKLKKQFPDIHPVKMKFEKLMQKMEHTNWGYEDIFAPPPPPPPGLCITTTLPPGVFWPWGY